MLSLKKKWDGIPLVVKVSTAYVICSIIQNALAFITLPLFTRMLTKEQYGQFTIYASWNGILMIFITLNLAYGSFSKAMVKYEDDREGYISAVEGITLCLALIFLAIYLPFRGLWNGLFELPTPIMLMMVLEILSVNAMLLWNGKKRFEYKYKAVVLITLFIAFLAPILAFILIAHTEEKGYARIIGYSAVNITVGVAFFLYNAIRGKKVFNKKYWKYALGFNIPLLAYYLSQVIFNQCDRIMISHMEGKGNAAVYGVAYTLAIVLNFVLNAINNSYIPWYYGKIKDGKMRDNRKASLIIAGIMAVLLLGVIWFAPEIILIMAGKKYLEAVYVVPPVAISLLLLFYAQLFINVEFYYEEKKKLVFASVGAAVVNLVLNYFFIELYGFIAAAYTTLASYLIFTIANYVTMKNVLKEKGIKDEGFNYKGLTLLFIIFSLIAYLGVILYGYLIPRIIVCVIVLIVIFVKRQFLIDFYKGFKSGK
ncbi:MAG: oligosaccharide flippase family protein [Lachnospiraceae bacterium]|nr:oligosaccharide flippase family protein [Lachnospiraceae bacterium]